MTQSTNWLSFVVDASISELWSYFRSLSFTHHPEVFLCTVEGKLPDDAPGSERKVQYKPDGSVCQLIRLKSLNDADTEIVWEVPEANYQALWASGRADPYEGAVFSVRLRSITEPLPQSHRDARESTFVETQVTFAKEVSPDIIAQDKERTRLHMATLVSAIRKSRGEDRR